MAKNELCTASCMMNDGERIVLGRTDKFGGGTTVVIWDLLANEAVRRMEYKHSIGTYNNSVDLYIVVFNCTFQHMVHSQPRCLHPKAKMSSLLITYSIVK